MRITATALPACADLASDNGRIGYGSIDSACGRFQDRLKYFPQIWFFSGAAGMFAIALKRSTRTCGGNESELFFGAPTQKIQ